METACSYGSKAEAFAAPTAEDIAVTVALDGEGPAMGQNAELSIEVRNGSSEKRTLDLHSQASVMYYTGVHKATVRRDRTDVDILPSEGERKNGTSQVIFCDCAHTLEAENGKVERRIRTRHSLKSGKLVLIT